jgi:hypothetical protein
MHASSSAIDSAFPPARRRMLATAPREVTKRTLRVVIVDIAIPGQDGEGVLDLRQERSEAVRVWLLTVLGGVSGLGREVRTIRAESGGWPRRVCERYGNTRGKWVHAVVLALLASCYAITAFFAFQAPFRLLASENHASTEELRGEIGALPIRAAGQTVSEFRAKKSHRSGDDREVVSASFDDSGSKGLPHERSVRRKQNRVRIESAEFSGHH